MFLWYTYLVLLFMLLYFPLALYNLSGLVSLRVRRSVNMRMPPVSGRRIVVQVTTNGQNPETTTDIISQIKSYSTPVEIFVVVEEYDTYEYPCNRIIVPSSYATANGSHKKMRAMQYAIEWFSQHGYGAETYIIHLDDDSIVKESYIQYVLGMDAEAGQGSLRLRGYGHHLMSTLADMIRVSDCDLYCRYFNRREKPVIVHGEGLSIRADVEAEIGWDFAGYGAEDFMMGVSIPSKGYRFTHIPDSIYIAPPVNAMDFYRQRRRWIYSIMDNRRKIWRINRTAFLFIIYRYAVGWTGLIGLILWLVDAVIGIRFSLYFLVIGLFNLIIIFAVYEHAVIITDRRYILIMIALLIPVALYESGTFIYTLLRPPKTNTFDVIKKVRL